MVYLIHFDHPFKHARHYLGFVDGDTASLNRRFKRHKRGKGAKLLAAVAAAGIPFRIVRTWPVADRTEERRLKAYHGYRLCPVCNPNPAAATGTDIFSRKCAALTTEEVV